MGQLFGRVLWPQTLWRNGGGHAHFPAKNRIFSKKASKDNSLLSYQKKIQLDWTKYGRVMAKKRMAIYGIIDILRDILAHNLAKYQNFSMRPGLFDKYPQITYSQQFVA